LFYVDVECIEELYSSLKERAEIVKPPETTWYGIKAIYAMVPAKTFAQSIFNNKQ